MSVFQVVKCYSGLQNSCHVRSEVNIHIYLVCCEYVYVSILYIAQPEGATVAIEPTDQAAPMNSTFEAGTSTSTEGEGEVEEESEVRCPCGCNEVRIK